LKTESDDDFARSMLGDNSDGLAINETGDRERRRGLS
jgi:hypothetical protein